MVCNADIKLVTGSLTDLQASGKGGAEPDPDREHPVGSNGAANLLLTTLPTVDCLQ